jgi:hypothetical protein
LIVNLNKMNIEFIQEKYNQYKDELVLYYFQIVRFVDVIYDENDDEFYYLLDKGNEMEKLSVVLEIYPIKGNINTETYNELKRIWNLNYKNKVK